MPTYQYQCTECGEALEAVQKFTDDALTECPSCAGRLRKVFSAVGVVFKGSGFYRNDSRGASSSGSPANGDSKGEPKDGSKSDSPSDAKSTKGTSTSGSDGGGSTSSGKSGAKPAGASAASGGSSAA